MLRRNPLSEYIVMHHIMTKNSIINDYMLGMPSHEIFFIQEGGKDTLGNVKGHQRFFPYLIK